jgi:hypothetical protein
VTWGRIGGSSERGGRGYRQSRGCTGAVYRRAAAAPSCCTEMNVKILYCAQLWQTDRHRQPSTQPRPCMRTQYDGQGDSQGVDSYDCNYCTDSVCRRGRRRRAGAREEPEEAEAGDRWDTDWQRVFMCPGGRVASGWVSGEAMWAGRCTGDGGREDGRSLSGAAGKRDDRSRQVRRGALRGEGCVDAEAVRLDRKAQRSRAAVCGCCCVTERCACGKDSDNSSSATLRKPLRRHERKKGRQGEKVVG